MNIKDYKKAGEVLSETIDILQLNRTVINAKNNSVDGKLNFIGVVISIWKEVDYDN